MVRPRQLPDPPLISITFLDPSSQIQSCTIWYAHSISLLLINTNHVVQLKDELKAEMKTHGAEHDVIDGMNAQGDSFYGSQGTYDL